MKYIDAEKIRAEIDRRYNEYSAKKKTDDFIYYSGMADALDLFEQFLDALSDENNPEPYSPVYDEDYLNEKITKASKTWEGVDVDKYMDEVRGRESDKSLEEEARTYCRSSFKFDYDELNDSFNSHAFEFYDVVELARHFAEWQYQKDRGEFAKIKAKTWYEGFDAYKQMFKDVVDGTVCIIRHNPPTVSVQIPVEDREGINISIGDKVRLLNVKED